MLEATLEVLIGASPASMSPSLGCLSKLSRSSIVFAKDFAEGLLIDLLIVLRQRSCVSIILDSFAWKWPILGIPRELVFFTLASRSGRRVLGDDR